LPATTETELQNPADDKGEKNNLAEKYIDKIKALKAYLLQQQHKAGKIMQCSMQALLIK